MKKCTKCKVKIPERGPAMCPSCIKKELATKNYKYI